MNGKYFSSILETFLLLYKILIHDNRFQCDVTSVLPIGKNIEKKITEHNKTKKIETDDKMTSPKLWRGELGCSRRVNNSVSTSGKSYMWK